MCTAISMLAEKHYFGRNLDLAYHYNESVTVTPRRFILQFSDGQKTDAHYAMIGMASVYSNYPLYYDATNECGLSVAALNFPGNAVYGSGNNDKQNIASYELIPWLLSQCSSVSAAAHALQSIHITDKAFTPELPPTPLHWMISDRNRTIVLESTVDGIRLYDNPICVLTNNPPFPYHLHNINNYLNVTAQEPRNRFSEALCLQPHSFGMGAIGLPGDVSSASRFVRAAFHLHNAVSESSTTGCINRFFKILGSVTQTEGCVIADGAMEKTVYSSCCDTDSMVYYYTTYENTQITAVDMNKENLDGSHLRYYPLRREAKYLYEN